MAVTTPDFFDMNLKISYDFSLYKFITLQLNAGVQNIFNAYQRDFDQGKERDSGYISNVYKHLKATVLLWLLFFIQETCFVGV